MQSRVSPVWRRGQAEDQSAGTETSENDGLKEVVQVRWKRMA